MDAATVTGADRKPTRRDGNPIVRWLHFLALSAGSGSTQSQRLRQATGYPITMTDTRALSLLMADEPLPISQVAEGLSVKVSRASRQITALEALGLVERFPGLTDARSSRVRTTAEGVRALRTWQRMALSDYVAVLASWSPSEITRFGNLLDTLVASLPFKDHHSNVPTELIDVSAWRDDKPRHEAISTTMPALLAFVVWASDFATSPTTTRSVLVEAQSPIAHQPLVALRVILRRGPLDVTELSRRLGLDTSRTSRRVAQLEEHGLIVRADDALDARRKRIKASREGATLIRKVDDAEFAPFAHVMKTWEEQDVADLLSLFDDFLNGMLARPSDVQTQVRPGTL